MELTQLRSFIQVAESGSITRAADRLFLTQPAVTQHIQALEQELGAALFDRIPRGMRLTAAGSLLLDAARKSLAVLEDCRLALRDLEAGLSGQVIIGAGVTTSIFVLPEWLRAFRERYPAIDVVVRTGRSREILTMLKDGEIHLGIITSPAEEPHLALRPLFEEEIVLAVPAGHPFAGEAISAVSLGELPLILFPPGSGFRTYLDSVLAQTGVPVAVKMETDSVEAIKRFVEVGLGASFLPISAVRQELAEGKLATVSIRDLPPMQRTTYLAYRTDRYVTGGMRGLMEGLLQCGMGNAECSVTRYCK